MIIICACLGSDLSEPCKKLAVPGRLDKSVDKSGRGGPAMNVLKI